MPGELTNIAASVRQRLLNLSYASSRPFNELLQHYAMERFLYRLGKSVHAGTFVLEGALMMLVWKVPVSRPTMDSHASSRPTLRNRAARLSGTHK